MSGILRRTVFVGPIPLVNGEKAGQKVMRFGDMASVVTGLGSMVEPWTWHDIHGVGSAQPADLDDREEIRRVDIIRPTNRGTFSDGSQVLHQYEQWFRA